MDTTDNIEPLSKEPRELKMLVSLREDLKKSYNSHIDASKTLYNVIELYGLLIEMVEKEIARKGEPPAP